MNAKDPTPSMDRRSREALAPVFADLNKGDATTHFIGQSTTVTLTGHRRPHLFQGGRRMSRSQNKADVALALAIIVRANSARRSLPGPRTEPSQDNCATCAQPNIPRIAILIQW